ncbi:DUF742 domain-containing protein [Nocardia aurantia]|uniref:DUF742 domain-containing protein n=1 Tax=Nocardia aurantia TaxID=2585199 RepID=A0A7K0DL02_9NOCA|nr:DUF742 domain-containing protein [Nocardia aurantia]MQY26367.1 hypothetical protein [Nocardia aurantia]
MTEPPRLPDSRMIPPARPETWSGASDQDEYARAAAEQGPVVRPFLMTGGRTIPLVDGLRLESMVYAAPAALSAPLRFEQHSVVRLCQQPHSIAEISAALRVPIGVARVVVSDLVTTGHVSVSATDELSIDAIERIRDLVRAL